jgi:lactoylglutathione lyase
MKIDHIGIWVRDLDKMTAFYTKYFKGVAGERYHNPHKKFTSCFIGFPAGVRLELMHNPEIAQATHPAEVQRPGYIHVSFSLGSENDVDWLTKNLAMDGFRVLDGPRRTGDGYYESLVLDPEENLVELTA